MTIAEQRQAYWRTIAALYADPEASAWARQYGAGEDPPACPDSVFQLAESSGQSVLQILKDIRAHSVIQPMKP